MSLQNKKKSGHARGRKGIALLLSILIMGAILTIMFAISDIAVKEFQLSGVGRESQKAYYAAETGYDCANYWEATDHVFSKTTAATPISCNGVSYGSYNKSIAQDRWDDSPPTPVINMTGVNSYNGLPVRVIVEPPSAGNAKVTIRVSAENTTVANSARKVQRTFEGQANACFANADVLLVIDRSEHLCGYLAGDYLVNCSEVDSAKTAATAFVNALSPTTGAAGTHMGMLSFGFTVSYPGGPTIDHSNGVVYATTPVTPAHTADHNHNASAALGSDAATINAEIGEIIAGGKPNTPDAIARAVDEFNLRGRSGVPHSIILITNRNPLVYRTKHDAANFPSSPTSALCFNPPHLHDERVGGNDEAFPPTPPGYVFSRAEATKVADYAKGTGQCGVFSVSAPIKIYVVGVEPSPADPYAYTPAYMASLASPASYYPVTNYSALQATLVDQVAACQ